MKPKNSGYEKTIEVIKSTHQMDASEAIIILAECAKKGFSLASQKAVATIAKLNHASVIPVLTELFLWHEEDSHKRDNNCVVRTEIIERLGDTGSLMAVEIVRKAARTVHITKMGPALEDMAIGLRAAAALALAKVDKDALFELSLLLFDKKPDVPSSSKEAVRCAAAQAISALGDVSGMPLLAVKLKFPEGETADVLAECLEALIFMKPSYLMEVVTPYLKGNNEYLAAITAIALAENFGEEMLDLLIDTLENVMGETKEALTIAIAATRCNRARLLLLDYLNNPSPFVRRGAVKGLKTYLDDEVIERLKIVHETDTDKIVRRESVI